MLDTVSYTTSVTEVEDQGQSLTGESEVMRKFDEAVGEGTLGQESLTESLDSGKVLWKAHTLNLMTPNGLGF